MTSMHGITDRVQRCVRQVRQSGFERGPSRRAARQQCSSRRSPPLCLTRSPSSLDTTLLMQTTAPCLTGFPTSIRQVVSGYGVIIVASDDQLASLHMRAVGRWSRRSPYACAAGARTAQGSLTLCARPAAARTTTPRRTWRPCAATCAAARGTCAAPRSWPPPTGVLLLLHPPGGSWQHLYCQQAVGPAPGRVCLVDDNVTRTAC